MDQKTDSVNKEKIKEIQRIKSFFGGVPIVISVIALLNYAHWWWIPLAVGGAVIIIANAIKFELE